MHYQTRSWARLSRIDRDARLNELGITNKVLAQVRNRIPRVRILEAARIAQAVDDEPNSDLIEYIAGYAPRSAVYHHFASMAELYRCAGVVSGSSPLPTTTLPLGHLDLAATIPTTLEGTAVHMDDVGKGKRFRTWQKVNGGMRSVVLNRDVRRMLFLAGVVLYAGEGTKSLKSGKVEMSNSNPGVLRLHVRFMEALGFTANTLKARVQIHSLAETKEAQRLWSKELGLSPTQFVKPLLSVPGNPVAKHTFTLQLRYANTMLLVLLRHWTSNADALFQLLDRD